MHLFLCVFVNNLHKGGKRKVSEEIAVWGLSFGVTDGCY